MKKTFWLDSRISKMEDAGDAIKISGYASTSNADRVGDIILPSAWTAKGGLDNYKKNPIILFNHNYNAPIGRATEIEVDEKGLKLTALISKEAPQYGLIKDEVLSTFSVGFLVKDLDYNAATDGFLIKDAELLETSVVTVPCNQDATFSLSKSFENRDELKAFLKKEFPEQSQQTEPETNVSEPVDDKKGAAPEKIKMDPEELKRLIAEATEKAMAEKAAKDEAAAKALADKKAEDEKVASAVEVGVKSAEERLMASFEKSLKESGDNWTKTLNEYKTELEAKNAELVAMANSKRNFSDRGGNSDDWQKVFKPEVEDAFLLSRVTGKGYETDFAKKLTEKVNTHSTVTVPNAAYETMALQGIEREIQNELIITPLFREINMTAANMTIPIMPDSGYAEITANTTASGTQPNGNMDRRGAPYGAPYEGITLTEVTLNTIKMISLSFLGNETEEDAVIPILPLIRESMVRSHVRGVENMILAGNDPDGVYTSGAKNGLIALARTSGRMLTTAGTSTPLTAAALFSMRRAMGKYGLRPQDVVYIVNQHSYFQLVEDAEFQDMDLVGDQASKITGEVGRIYGSKVLMSDEFAAPAAGRFHALAVNTRNFVVPRLRGMTVESDYEVREQRRVLVTSQRLGFAEIIPDATSVVGLRYATA